LILVDDRDGILLLDDLVSRFAEHLEIACAEINTINIIAHVPLPFLLVIS
jgi:hypothetical protein